MMRSALHLVVGALVSAVLISCATRQEPAPPAATAGPSPTPAAPTPAPAATPTARYTATVRVEGGETTQADITPPAPASPSPSPSSAPTSEASPSPSPAQAAAQGNFFSNAWNKVFPPKPKADPPAANAAGAPSPFPSPAATAPRPGEGFFTRLWHKVFPRKETPPAAAPPLWIGTIKLINERDGYALIDAQSALALTPGETLNAVGGDAETGVLRVTADRNPPFFIADLVSGKPQPGDRVYSPTP